ncbi:MAG: hypothetical protein ACXIUM_08095 [Wenzhouxiangella sp.]
MNISKLDGNPLPLPFQPTVRISIPAKVAYDLGSLQKTLANLAERLGCQACLSGANCLFEIQRDFVVNDRFEVNPRQPF